MMTTVNTHVWKVKKVDPEFPSQGKSLFFFFFSYVYEMMDVN